MVKNLHIWELYTYFTHGLFFVEAFELVALNITIPWSVTFHIFK